MGYNCSICLENNCTVNFNDTDKDAVKWFTKLKYIVPELVQYSNYFICETCLGQLKAVLKFRNRLIQLVWRQRSLLENKDVGGDSNIDYYMTENTFLCSVCYKIFTTLTQLHHHEIQNHGESKLPRNEPPEYVSELPVLAGKSKKTDFFTCFDCDNDFDSKDTMFSHIVKEHQTKASAKTSPKEINVQTGMEDENLIQTHKCLSINSCKVCAESFSTENLLKNHLKTCEESNSSSYICDSCNNFYTTERNLSLHRIWCNKNKQESGELIIDKCNQASSSENPTKRRGRKSLRTFTCEICNKQFSYVKLVLEHCMSVHSMKEKTIKPYSCDKCNQRFSSSANLDQHQKYHDRNRTHICSSCGKGFITKSDLMVHEYTHFNRRNYKCSKCDKAFNTNKNLRTHNLVVHTDRTLWKYGCSTCEKRFPLKANYEQHLKRHTGDKQHICHICKKSFISKSELKRHVHLHSNIKDFRCDRCDKEYREVRTYKMHLAKAHGVGDVKIPVKEKKFVCHICPSQFYDKQKLSRHLCGHSGLKPFACCSCDKKFADKSYLKHHMKVAHRE